jgi:hypothetical protein
MIPMTNEIIAINKTNQGYEYVMSSPIPKYGYFIYLDGMFIRQLKVDRFTDLELRPYEVVSGASTTASHTAGNTIRLQWASVAGATHYIIKAKYGNATEWVPMATVMHQGSYTEWQATDITGDTDARYTVAPAVEVGERIAPIADPLELRVERLSIPPPPELEPTIEEGNMLL